MEDPEGAKPNWIWRLIVLGAALLLMLYLALAVVRRIRKPDTTQVPDIVPMVLVRAGPFRMGSDPELALAECENLLSGAGCQRSGFEDQEPVHTVKLDDFLIDRYEVTNARYAECVDAGKCFAPSSTASSTRQSYYGNAEYDDYPVILVSWFDAKRHCEWRGARLPTEAEWEKAARGTDGRLYPWGNALASNRANFCDRNCRYDWAHADYDDGYADTAPVGSYSMGISPYGVYDMAGNVWEWVSDWYDADYYSASPSENPTGPSSGQFRVARGGAWFSQGISVLAPHRMANVPTAGYHLVGGFRCAQSP